MKRWVSNKNQTLAGADESNPTLWKLAVPHYRARNQSFRQALLSQDVHQPRRLQPGAKSAANETDVEEGRTQLSIDRVSNEIAEFLMDNWAHNKEGSIFPSLAL